MAYTAPRLDEVGTVHGLTLGRQTPGPKKDNSVWSGYAGPPDKPPVGSHPPVGSR